MTLSNSVNLMKEGSKKGFDAFFEATVNYSYSLAMKLFSDREKAKAFLEDFYIYLYMHISNYKGEGDEKSWINRQMLIRYKGLSHGMKSVNELTFDGGGETLTKNEITALYRKLSAKIKFPPEEKKLSPRTVITIVLAVIGVVILIFLVAGRLNNAYGGSVENDNSEVMDADDIMRELETDGTDSSAGITDDTGNITSTTIQVIHDSEDSGETKKEQQNYVDEPAVDVPGVETPVVDEPEVTVPEIEAPVVEAPVAPSDASPAPGSGGSSPGSSASTAMEDFLEEVEKFENYDIGG